MLKEVKLNCLNGKVIKEIVASEDPKWVGNKSTEGMYRDPTIFFEDGTQAVFGALGGESCHFWTNVKEHAPPQMESQETATEELIGGCCVSACCASSFDFLRSLNSPKMIIKAFKPLPSGTLIRAQRNIDTPN